jgi:hypothetical protein
MSEIDDIDWDKWPRAELVGGPLDGRKILAPEPKYRAPLAMPATALDANKNVDADDIDLANIRLHWYVPMTYKNLLQKLSVFYYAYAGDTFADEPNPDVGTLYQRSTLAHPELSKNDDV